ncbi:MAG: ABC transporter substrate-binding protein, partial [Chloroflexi bacterium]|nr:ABC transporter substrate-binding protein [Chloroflexota bacterium]
DDVTGVGAIEGALLRINADLVIQQINSSGGINGHPVQPVYVDPKGQADQALQMATQLAQQDNVDVLLGGIFSPECLGVQQLAPKVGLAYLPLNGCANEQFTSQSCNKFSFRVFPVGKQLSDPALSYEVKTFGPKWGILYPDYALGQSSRDSYDASLKKFNATLDLKIGVPLNETNMTPYISKVPTDGSINALVVSQTGSDLARAMTILQQFGIPKKMAIVTALGKESFSGVYPDAMNGAYISGGHLSEAQPDNKFDQAYDDAFKAMAKTDASVAGPLGGPDKAVSGVTNGYNVYVSMNALKIAMRNSGFTGKADTAKLITALENLNEPQSADFPAGPMVMNKQDHQGRMTLYVMKINGQKEDVIQSFPPDQLPLFNSCTAS